MARNLVRAVVLLILSVAVNVAPMLLRPHIPYDLSMVHMPGLLIAIYLEAFGIATVSDWRGDFTEAGEILASLASVVFWWLSFAGAFALVSRLRKRALTSR